MGTRALLIVDDEEMVIRSLERQLRREGYAIHCAGSGIAGIECVKAHEIGVVLSDQMMPEIDGIRFLEKVRELRPEVVRILITGNGSMANAVDAVNRAKVFAYLTKPWSFEELTSTLASAFEHYELVMENRRLERLTQEQNRELRFVNNNLDALVRERTAQLEEAVLEGVLMLALAAEAKDDDTGGHVYRIQNLTYHICQAMGMSPERSKEIGFFSIMHDVGKIHIPDKILKKQGPLSKEEWEIMKTHAIVGAEILHDKPYYRTAREIARSHHEHWDGSGYPDGLKGSEIPLSARVVAVADVFDALTHERPYKKAWGREETVSKMKSLSGVMFDPEILAAFLHTPIREWTPEPGIGLSLHSPSLGERGESAGQGADDMCLGGNHMQSRLLPETANSQEE